NYKTLMFLLMISTRVQALHPTKTISQEQPVDSREHTKEAYKSKDTLELLRSLVVFKLYPPVCTLITGHHRDSTSLV
uniref:Uncharacterized protein n=1 Tax=Sinocyclocheilus rhinocerous TaxID=307959 RepID=A0A673IIE0_9TELE